MLDIQGVPEIPHLSETGDRQVRNLSEIRKNLTISYIFFPKGHKSQLLDFKVFFSKRIFLLSREIIVDIRKKKLPKEISHSRNTNTG